MSSRIKREYAPSLSYEVKSSRRPAHASSACGNRCEKGPWGTAGYNTMASTPTVSSRRRYGIRHKVPLSRQINYINHSVCILHIRGPSSLLLSTGWSQGWMISPHKVYSNTPHLTSLGQPGFSWSMGVHCLGVSAHVPFLTFFHHSGPRGGSSVRLNPNRGRDRSHHLPGKALFDTACCSPSRQISPAVS